MKPPNNTNNDVDNTNTIDLNLSVDTITSTYTDNPNSQSEREDNEESDDTITEKKITHRNNPYQDEENEETTTNNNKDEEGYKLRHTEPRKYKDLATGKNSQKSDKKTVTRRNKSTTDDQPTKETPTAQTTLLETLKLDNKQLTKQIAQTNKEKDNLNKRLKQATTEIKERLTTIEETQTELDNRNREIIILKEKNEILTSTNNNLEQIAKEQREELANMIKHHREAKVKPQETTPTTVTIIADSNRRFIAQHLDPQVKWIIPDNIYTIKDLTTQRKKGALNNIIRGSNRTLIMMGTNDIRTGGMDPHNAAKTLIQNAEELTRSTKIPTTIITPPPMKISTNPEAAIQIAIMNLIIKENPSKYYTIIDTEEILENIPKSTSLQKDGFHLSDLGARIVAKQINKKITETLIPSNEDYEYTLTVDDHHETETFHQIPTDMIGHVVGKGGTMITRIADNHNVTISIKEREVNGTSTQGALITGPQENIKQAREFINDIIVKKEHEMEERSTRKEERSSIICTYHSYGKGCRYGDQCHYKPRHKS